MIQNCFLTVHIGNVQEPDMYAEIQIERWQKENKETYNYLLKHGKGNVKIERKQVPHPVCLTSEYIDDAIAYQYNLYILMSQAKWAYFYLVLGKVEL